MDRREMTWEAVEGLKPYDGNSRTHTDEQIARVAASMAEFGWTNPILADETGTVLAGHARLLAAKRRGMREVPVVRIGGLSAEQKRAYVIADNRLALDAGWDEAVLAEELAALQAEDYDLALTGFSDEELERLLGETAEEDASQDPDALEYRVIVDCDDENHQAALLEHFEREGLKCRPLIS